MQAILITALGGVIVAGISSLTAFNMGKKIERGVWQEANVETLVGANENLSFELGRMETELANNNKLDIDTSNNITKTETRIIEKIVEVPVEKIVKINEDCSIDFGIVGLRNSWAAGSRHDEKARDTATGYLPLVGSSEVSGKTISD